MKKGVIFFQSSILPFQNVVYQVYHKTPLYGYKIGVRMLHVNRPPPIKNRRV